MKIKTVLIVLVLVLVAIGGWVWWQGQATVNSLIFSPTNMVPSASSAPGSVPLRVSSVTGGLEVPWALVFTSPNRILVTERPGRIRVIENGQLKPQPIKVIDDVVARGEAGLMGMAYDHQNSYVYVCYTYQGKNGLQNKVVRYLDVDTELKDETLILGETPSAQFHAGCELAFGPDGKLYVTAVDASDRSLAQNMNSLAGKILRLNPDGSLPEDNPFDTSFIFSYGHRNPQGLAWHPDTDQLWSTEHGPSGFDGPGGGDEINLIEKGGNYGWPVVSHDKTAETMISPKYVFTPAVAPASAVFYQGLLLPQFRGKLLLAGLRGSGIYVAELNGEQIVKVEKLGEVEVGRIRELVESPMGTIYFTTSNRDGRGKVGESDDHVYVLEPVVPTDY
jgi:glucose/arabinose dehydrogenase